MWLLRCPAVRTSAERPNRRPRPLSERRRPHPLLPRLQFPPSPVTIAPCAISPLAVSNGNESYAQHLSTLIATAFTCLSSQATRAAAPESWNSYRNERFGLSLSYPGTVFAPDRTAEAGDGQLMVSKDGSARLLIGGLLNADGRSPAAYQDFIARQSYADYRIDYRRLGSNWFVLSGEGNGKIFYEKVMFSCAGRLINSFALIYAADERHVFDPIVERIENSYRPGQNCEQAVIGTPPPRREARQPGPSRTSRATHAQPLRIGSPGRAVQM